MKKYTYSDEEQNINTILVHQQKQFDSIEIPHVDESRISESESLLKSLGYTLPKQPLVIDVPKSKEIVVPSWEQLLNDANSDVGAGHELTELFTDAEL